jgi:transposase
MKQQHQDSEVTIGLDLGERRHRFCVLNGQGEVIEEGSLLNDRASLEEFSGRYGGALTVMEAGCHSPWISRYLEQLGCEVVVSNPRKTRAIYQHERKSDQRDALMLARIGRIDLALLYPVRLCHRRRTKSYGHGSHFQRPIWTRSFSQRSGSSSFVRGT